MVVGRFSSRRERLHQDGWENIEAAMFFQRRKNNRPLYTSFTNMGKKSEGSPAVFYRNTNNVAARGERSARQGLARAEFDEYHRLRFAGIVRHSRSFMQGRG